ncbi:MAG: 30S ribosomal protein S8 [Candidatus Omnitrophota bacterium]
MAFTDSIANMLTLIRNAVKAKHEKVDIPHSKMITAIADLMKQEGYIENYRVIKDTKQGILRVYLRYFKKKPVILGLKRVSRCGLRRYADAKHIPYVLRGKGTVILTTSKGLMTGAKAREQNVGGEVLCYIW